MTMDIVNELAGRADGPMHLRLLLQPTMAILFAAKDGVADARKNADPFLVSLAMQKGQRKSQIIEAWASVGTVFSLAFLFDLIYQHQTAASLDFGMAAAIAMILCAVPYCVVRGPVARITARRIKATASST
ncbi:MAG: hypothetical protein ACU0BB_15580 [Paracoccaceae bacterium]